MTARDRRRAELRAYRRAQEQGKLFRQFVHCGLPWEPHEWLAHHVGFLTQRVLECEQRIAELEGRARK